MTDTVISRECGTCTACCQGWLRGTVRGHEMYPGKVCHFLGCDGCTDYENRPQSPCKDFECVWLNNNNIPEWMKPELSKVIIKEMEYEYQIHQQSLGTASWVMENEASMVNKVKFWYVTEMGETISGPVLNWLVQFSLEHSIPMVYEVGGKREFLGPPDFILFMEQNKDRPLQMTK